MSLNIELAKAKIELLEAQNKVLELEAQTYFEIFSENASSNERMALIYDRESFTEKRSCLGLDFEIRKSLFIKQIQCKVKYVKDTEILDFYLSKKISYIKRKFCKVSLIFRVIRYES